jgi:hypothetical protein
MKLECGRWFSLPRVAQSMCGLLWELTQEDKQENFRERGEEESNRKVLINANEHGDLFPRFGSKEPTPR